MKKLLLAISLLLMLSTSANAIGLMQPMLPRLSKTIYYRCVLVRSAAYTVTAVNKIGGSGTTGTTARAAFISTGHGLSSRDLVYVSMSQSAMNGYGYVWDYDCTANHFAVSTIYPAESYAGSDITVVSTVPDDCGSSATAYVADRLNLSNTYIYS